MKLSDLSQHERISELLRDLGQDKITLERFWHEMRSYGLTDKEIDAFCRGQHVR